MTTEQVGSSPEPPLQIQLLGRFHAQLNGRPLSEFGRSKARTLLAFLALECHRDHDRATLAALFWPDRPLEQGLVVLRQVLFTLTHLLETPDGTSALITVSRFHVRLNAAYLQLDVHQLLDGLRGLQLHHHRRLDRCLVCAPRLHELLHLAARGSLWAAKHDNPQLDHWYQAWQAQIETALNETAAALLSRALRYREWHSAEAIAQRWRALQPWQEVALRGQIEALARRGERNAALRAYRRAETVIQQELGCEPEAATRRLVEQIRRGEILPLPALPADLPLIGRSDMILQLTHLLAQPATRLVTLLGIGGIGKTTLALALAQRIAPEYADGTLTIALGELRDRHEVLVQIALQLGLELTQPARLAAAVPAALQMRDLLLVLDECEQLAGIGELTALLLQAAPRLQILCTSRLPLLLRDEYLVRVSGLPVPSITDDAALLLHNDGVRLFLDHAQRRLPIDGNDAQVLQQAARICRAVDGSPLGLLLAAAQLRSIPLLDLVTQLEQTPQHIAAALADLPERHHKLTAMIDHSFSRLSQAERDLMLCAVRFEGTFSHETLIDLGAQLNPAVNTGTITRLIDHSLLHLTPDGRLRTHTLVRRTLLPYLTTQPAYRTLEQRYRSVVLMRAAQQSTRLRRTLNDTPQVTAEFPDLRSAWLSAARDGDSALLVRVLTPVFEVLILIGAYDTARQFVETAIAATADGQDTIHWQLRTLLESEHARILHYLGESAAALAACDRAEQAAVTAGDSVGRISAMTNRARVKLHIGSLVEAEREARAAAHLAQSQALTTQLRALPEFFAAVAAACRGDVVRATTDLLAVAEVARLGGFGWAAGDALSVVAALQLFQGQPGAAITTLRRAFSAYFVTAPEQLAWTRYVELAFAVCAGEAPLHTLRHALPPTLNDGSGLAQVAGCVMVTGMILLWSGVTDAAYELLTFAQQLARTDASLWGSRAILMQRSTAALAGGRTVNLRELQTAQQTALLASDPRIAGQLSVVIAAVYEHEQRPMEAQQLSRQAMQLFEQAGAAYLQVGSFARLARLALAAGDNTAALYFVEQLLELPQNPWGVHDYAEIVLTCAEILMPHDAARAAALRSAAAVTLHSFAQQLPTELRAVFAARAAHRTLLEGDLLSVGR